MGSLGSCSVRQGTKGHLSVGRAVGPPRSTPPTSWHNLPKARPTTPACAGDRTAGDDRQLRRSVVVRLHWTFVVGLLLSAANLIY